MLNKGIKQWHLWLLYGIIVLRLETFTFKDKDDFEDEILGGILKT